MNVPLHQVVRTPEDLSALEAKVLVSAQKAAESLSRILAESKPLDALAKVKFEDVGFHPIQDRALNFIEQINQTFTFVASLRAAA